MSSYKQTGCKDCGAQCHGQRCAACEQTRANERNDLGVGDDYECPECGGTTSGPDVVCFQCRGDN